MVFHFYVSYSNDSEIIEELEKLEQSENNDKKVKGDVSGKIDKSKK